MKSILALNLQLHEDECYFIASQIFETAITFICAVSSSLQKRRFGFGVFKGKISGSQAFCNELSSICETLTVNLIDQ